MNYKFKYKSHLDRRTFRQMTNKLCSDFLFLLYENWFFKKLKLDKNLFLKSHIAFGRKRVIPTIDKSTIPDNPNLDIYSITFLDCIEIEDTEKLKSRLIKIVSKYKGGFLSGDPEKKLKQSFVEFESSYKTTSWGNIFYNDTKGDDELDLIDGISYGYIKGSQSHFVITFTVYPSDKFKKLFHKSLKTKITQEFEIIFKSLNQILKTKKLYTSIGSNIKESKYWTEKVLNEITCQFKSKLACNLKLGVFNKNNKVLFPRIISFEYDPIEFAQYNDELFQKVNISIYEYYNDSETIFTLKHVDYSKRSSAGLEIFIPFKSEEEKRNDPFTSISYLSENYIKAISSYWLLINLAALHKLNIVKLRKKTFTYIRKNKVSLFLRKVIKLKNKVTLDWISFERIRNDFSTDTFKRNLKFNGIPDLHNTPLANGIQPNEFKSDLVQLAINSSIDIKETYEEILKLYSHVSEDNTLRANMRLQRLLFWIALIGVLVAIYSTNSHWFNSWIKYYLSNWGLKIPTIPKMK